MIFKPVLYKRSFVNLLEDKSVLVGRETMYQITSNMNNHDITKICMPALSHKVHADKSNLQCRHLGLLKFIEGSAF